MHITVTTRNIDNKDSAEKLKEYVRKKAEKRLEKYVRAEKNPSEVKVILSVEKFRNTAEILVNSGTFKVVSSAEREDMNAAIDAAVDGAIKQLKKQAEKKFKTKRRGGGKTKEDSREEANKFEKTADAVGKADIERVDPKPMSAKEAVLQLTLSDKDFLAFHNSETGKINVVYKRKGGRRG